MALLYYPKQGTLLICGFDEVALGAEMIKRRPVVVVSRRETHNRRLCTVVPLSTTAPPVVHPWHHAMPHLRVPGLAPNGTIWAKCDMICTVSFERLDKPHTKSRGGRVYVTQIMDPADMTAITNGVRSYLGL